MPSNSSLTNDRKPSLSSTSKIPPPALFFPHLALRRYLTSNVIGVPLQGRPHRLTTNVVVRRSSNFRLLAGISRSYPLWTALWTDRPRADSAVNEGGSAVTWESGHGL